MKSNTSRRRERRHAGASAPSPEANLPCLDRFPLTRTIPTCRDMNRWISMTRNIAFAIVICGLPCLAKTPSGTLQVDVNNYVLYNYDTFDTTQFGMNPSATS
jgi:hypothetical protein